MRSIEQWKAYLLENSVRKNGCLLTTLVTSLDGYGYVRFNGRMRRIHRVAMHLWRDFDLDSEIQILHKCHTPRCFNPEHLEEGDNSKNMRDAQERGTLHNPHRVKTHCPQGHPYDEENTRAYKGRRYCRACQKQVNQARQTNQQD